MRGPATLPAMPTSPQQVEHEAALVSFALLVLRNLRAPEATSKPNTERVAALAAAAVDLGLAELAYGPDDETPPEGAAWLK